MTKYASSAPGRRFQQTVRKIIAWDLDWIARSDYLVCYWDSAAARGAGTQGELTFAHRAGIPVYMVLAMPVGEVSGWVLGCASEVFENFGQLCAFLRTRYGAHADTGNRKLEMNA